MGGVASALSADQAALLAKLDYMDIAAAQGETVSGLRNTGTDSITMVSQRALFAAFKARRNFVCNNVATYSLATAAATVTHAFMGLYSIDVANTTLTLQGVTNDNLTFWGSSNARNIGTLLTPVQIIAGNLYALAALIVATTPPTIMGTAQAANTVLGQQWQIAPQICGFIAGLNALPSSTTWAAMSQNGGYMFGEILP